jgi:hypothetical protein
MLGYTNRSVVPLLLLSAAVVSPSGRAWGKSALSPATAACVKQAAADRKICLVATAASECTVAYHLAYANCFAAVDGVACATTCEATRSTCEKVPQAANKACARSCGVVRKTALKSCAAGDVTCTAAAQADYSSCRKACTQASLPGMQQCRADFAACITQCAGL